MVEVLLLADFKRCPAQSRQSRMRHGPESGPTFVGDYESDWRAIRVKLIHFVVDLRSQLPAVHEIATVKHGQLVNANALSSPHITFRKRS
jgi:hypothetical protein